MGEASCYREDQPSQDPQPESHPQVDGFPSPHSEEGLSHVQRWRRCNTGAASRAALGRFLIFLSAVLAPLQGNGELTSGLSGAGPSGFEYKQDAPSRVHSRPLVSPRTHFAPPSSPSTTCRAFSATRGSEKRFVSNPCLSQGR